VNRLGGRRLSSWLPRQASGVVSSAGHAAVALVLAGGLVTGGLTALMVAADRTLDGASSPRVAAGPGVTPLPGTLRVDGSTPGEPGGPPASPTTGPAPKPSGSDRAPATLDDTPDSPGGTATSAPDGSPDPTVTEQPTTVTPSTPRTGSGGTGQGTGQGGGQGHAYGHDKDRGNGHAYGHDKDRGNGHAYGHDKDHGKGHAHGHDKDHGNGHAYGHDKDHGKGHAYGHDKDHGNGHAADRSSQVRPASHRSAHQPS
jgi:hypothetical protein